jgi:hypothetical protein
LTASQTPQPPHTEHYMQHGVYANTNALKTQAAGMYESG